MAKPRPSALKRQREQAKRDKKAAKAERKLQRKTEGPQDDDMMAAPETEGDFEPADAAE